MKRLTLAVALLAGAFSTAGVLAPAPVFAFETAATVKAKINLAGRQRMLSQRVASLACQLHLDPTRDEARAALGQAHGDFNATLHALRFGDPKRNLQPEESSQIVHYLDAVSKEWTPLNSSLRPALKGKPVDKAALEVVAQRNLPVLEKMDKTVRRMARTYSDVAGAGGNAKAVNWAGAQRMFTQRMAKAACMMTAGVAVDESRFELTTTIGLFEKRLAVLRAGDAQQKVAPPANAEVSVRFDEAAALWADVGPRLRAVAEGETLDAAGVADVAAELDRLLKASHAAVVAMVAAGA